MTIRLIGRDGVSRGRRFLAGVLLLAGSGAACGLIDLDSFRGVNFELPPTSYVVDTTDPEWDAPPIGIVPVVACTGEGRSDACCNPPGLMPIDCNKYKVECTQGRCVFRTGFENAQTVDLASNVTQLQQVSGDVLQDVFLRKLRYEVKNNLNVHLPPVDVYVGPQNAKHRTDAGVLKVVTIPSKASGFSGTEEIAVDKAGQKNFSVYAKNFKVPFNILTVFDVNVFGGELVPMGRADIKITGTVEARF